jgi:hypothetical protein
MKQYNYIFLDIDGVLATTMQYYTNRKKWNSEYNRYRFDEKCVNVFNQIIEKISDLRIVLSSDWKEDYTLDILNRIFEINGVKTKIFDKTPNLWGIKYFSLQELEECRSMEILQYINEHIDICQYVAIDDLDLSTWIPDNFIITPRSNEGIKQSGIKHKILTKFL